MKKAALLFLPVLFVLLVIADKVFADTAVNLISNPSVENSKNGSPTNWSSSKTGTNTTTFTYQKNGYDGTRSLYINIKSFKSGNAKWFFKPVTALPDTKYIYSEFYKSNTKTSIYLETTNVSGTKTTALLTTVPAASSWSPVNLELTTPSSAATITVYHVINSVGTLQTDLFTLSVVSDPGTIPPDTSPPPPAPIPPTTSPPVDQPGNLIQNFSLETVSDSSTTLPKYWATDKYGTNTVNFIYPSSAHTGSTGARIDITKYTSGDAKWIHDEIPVQSNTSYKFEDYYRSNATTEVDAEFHMSDGSVQYKNLGTVQSSDSWNKFSVTFTTPANIKSVVVFHLIDAVGFLETDDYFLGPSSTPSPPPPSNTFERPLISLTFDDGYLSQYQNGFPILKKYSLNATFYIVTSYLGTSDYLTKNNMLEISSAGNEIGSHTMSHVSLITLSDSMLNLELSSSQSILQSILGKPVTDFSSPLGEYNDNTLATIKKYYISNRTSDDGYNTKSNLDLSNIKVQKVRADVPTATVKSWVDKAKSDNSWLVLTYHRVESSTSDLYNTIPQDLDDQLSYIKQSGITVKPINDAINEVLPQIGK